MKALSHFIALLSVFIVLLPSSPIRAQFLTPEIKTCITTGELTAAADLLSEYVRQNPDRLNAYLLLARVHLGIGGPNPNTAAEKALREAIHRFPGNTRILRMLIEVKKKQDMPLLAEAWMAKTIEADPDDSDLLGELVDSYLFTEKKAQAYKLKPLLESAIEAAPERAINYVSLAKLELSRDSLDVAIGVLNKAMEFDAINPSLYRPLSDAYLKKGLGNECTDYYYQWLGLEADFEVLEKEFEIAALTMPNETADEFKKLPWYEKKRFLLRYWRDQDPYPVTEANERLIEHFRRVLFSLDAFRTKEGKLGFDDRGKVYIRWGEPEEWSEKGGKGIGGLETEIAESAKHAFDPYAPTATGLARQFESFYYPSYGLFVAFDFVNFSGGYYQEVSSIEQAIPGGSGTSAARKLYASVTGMGGIYAILGRDPSPSSFMYKLHDFEMEIRRAKHDAMPKFEIDLKMPELDFVYRTAQFRSDSGRTRLELAYGVPLEQENLKSVDPSAHEFDFRTEFIVLDSLRMKMLHAHSRIPYTYLPDMDFAGHFVNTEIASAQPGDYKMTFQVTERTVNSGDFIIEPMVFRDFTKDSLMLSDLKFSRKAEERGIDERTKKELIETEPYPFAFVKKSEPVFLYFEIYNLTLDPNERSDYRVSLLVERRRTTGEYFALPISSIGSIFSEGRPRRIETLYNRQGDSQTGVEYIRLDIAGLESGYSRLTVTVEDLAAGGKAQQSIEFDLVE